MKKMYLFVTWLIVAIQFGCSDNEPGPGIIEGIPTYMSVSITFPQSGPDMRAPSDPNATHEEVAIKSVDIFIYQESGQYLTHTPMNPGLFVPVPGSDDHYVSTELIRTTTGKKFVYAGINLPASTVAAIERQSMWSLANEACTFSIADLTTPANGIPMFSVAASAENFSENPSDTGNHVSIKVKRLVAKVTVEKSANMIIDGVPGTLGPIEFAINNFNTKMYLQQGDAPQCKDPNWDTYNPLDFVDTPASDYVAVHDMAVHPNPTTSDYHALYASENTSAVKMKKEITRVTVRSTFLPDEITVVDGASPDGYKQEPRPGTITSPETFYSVTPGMGGSTRYFYDKTVADKYAADKGGTVSTYTNGQCYWDMFLNKNQGPNQWDVLRNDYYKCTITRIIVPGRDTPDIKRPDETPDGEANIAVDIHILFWNPVLLDYILEP